MCVAALMDCHCIAAFPLNSSLRHGYSIVIDNAIENPMKQQKTAVSACLDVDTFGAVAIAQELTCTRGKEAPTRPSSNGVHTIQRGWDVGLESISGAIRPARVLISRVGGRECEERVREERGGSLLQVRLFTIF